MIHYSPRQSNQESETFVWNGGMDSVNDPLLLAPGKFTACTNIDLNETGPKARIGYAIMGSAGAVQVNNYGVIKKESGDIICRAAGTKFQKYSAGAWSDVSSITAISTRIVSFNCSDLTTAAATSGTATASSTNRTLVVSGGAMTVNAYAGKILRITSGTGSGQEKFIASNDLTTIYVEGLFETTPDGTSVFDVREVAPHVIVSNGTDTVFKYDGSTVTTFSTMTKWQSLEVAHNRLFASRRDSDLVYVSNLGTQYFPKDNYLPINPDGDSIVGLKKMLEEVIVYKKNTRTRIVGDNEDNFGIVPCPDAVGAIAQDSIASGNNFQFFLGYGGIYCVNALDGSSLDEGLPISRYINDQILAHSAAELIAAVGWVSDNKYFCSIGNEVFVYDIKQSQVEKTNVFTRYQYAQSISAAINYGGTVYLGTATKSVTVGGVTDDGTTITCDLTTGRITQKDKNQYKMHHRDYVNFAATATTVTVQAGFDGGSLATYAAASVATDGQIRMPINVRARDVKYKYSFPADASPQMVSHETFFNRLTKTI